MADTYGLDASDYAGMDPSQMLQTAGYQRKLRVDNAQLADSLRQTKMKEQQLQQQEKWNRVNLKMQQVEQRVQSTMDAKKLKLREQQQAINERLATAQETNAQINKEKLEAEKSALETQQLRMKQLGGMKVQTNVSDEPITAATAMFLKAQGLPVKFSEESGIHELMKSPEDGEVYAIMKDGTAKVVTGVDLSGAERLTTKQEVTTFGPGERSELSTKGRQRGEIVSSDYVRSFKDELLKNNREYRHLTRKTEIPDDIPETEQRKLRLENQKRQEKAKKILVNAIRTDLESQLDTKVQYGTDTETGLEGFYYKDANGNLKRARGAVNAN